MQPVSDKKQALFYVLVLCIIAALFFLFPPYPAHAQTIAELTAQIEKLQRQVAVLQEQLRILKEGGEEGASTFVRDLALGDSGADVKMLQEVLNTDVRTRLAKTGPGSPGNETIYFGTRTRRAVIAFQELFKTQILLPLGLSEGTGFVGPSTRKILNDILVSRPPESVRARGTVDQQVQAIIEELLSTPVESPRAAITQKETKAPLVQTVVPEKDSADGVNQEIDLVTGGFSAFNLSFTFPESKHVDIFFPSQYNGLPGDEVTLTGSGFTKTGNTIYFGAAKTFTNIGTSDSAHISFAVPDVPPGRYFVSVENQNGKSESMRFIVRNVDIARPSISYISPESGRGTTTVSIHGSGFLNAGNTVYTGYGIIDNIPSHDGKTITVSIIPPTESGTGIGEPRSIISEEGAVPGNVFTGLADQLWLYVENVGGLSDPAFYDYYYDPDSF